MNAHPSIMNTLDRNEQSRLTGRARAGAAPATVAVRLLRPSVARALINPPIRLGLHSRGLPGLPRGISITR